MPVNHSNFQAPGSETDDPIANLAALWLARHDRGLSAAEAAEFSRWRAADPRHAAEFSRIEQAWGAAELAKADPELVSMAQALDDSTRTAVHRRVRRSWLRLAMLGAAAAVIGVVWVTRRTVPPHSLQAPDAMAAASAATANHHVIPSTARHLALADGSTVGLHGDSEVQVEFSPDERRVRLVRGEAFFEVAKDAARPFVVKAAAVAVHAVGTAFNVRLEPAAIDVLVTEGKVRITDVAHGATLLPPNPSFSPDAIATQTRDTHEAPRDWSNDPLLAAGHRAVVAIDAVSGAPAKAKVTAVDRDEIERTLDWQGTLLVFQRTSLGEAVDAFNRHGAQQLVFGDPALRQRLLGGSFRPDNVEAFVRLLEKSADVKAERLPDGTIVLRAAP